MPTRNLFTDPSSPEASAESAYERIERLMAEDSPIHGIDSLEALETYVETTALISLDRSRQNAVFGVGAPDADLLIIGEAPGAQEDKQGEPFVGRAGKLLDKILEAIDFSRDEVYITNILKSRTPQNRNPRSDEVEAHLPILYKQLALIRPKLILCVGKVAANTLLNRSSSLGSMRGTFHDFHGLPTMVTYHPAALLRNPQWKRPTWEDVKQLRRRYDELTREQ
jgi:DNA polymerase